MSRWPSRIAGIMLTLNTAGIAAGQEAAAPVYPNLHVEISRDFANAVGKQDIDQTDPVSQQKDRITIVGVQHTRALVGLDFVPSARGAVVELALTGSTDANTDAYQGPVRLNLTTRVSYTARKR